MDTLILRTQRLVHLDLKGAPPKLSYFEKFFPLIKDVGATGILLEWEDTFPFTRELLPIGGLSNSAQVSGAPYSLEEAQQLLNLAADCELMVIPLLQTFGHMEYVLKHEQWRGLREVENYPSSMCPSNSETMTLVRSMIKQVVAFHPGIQYIHIGADEVWHMGACPACSKRLLNNKYGKAGIYLDHVTQVAQFIKDNYPSLKIIIWDDMLRNVDAQVLQDYYLGKLVEPMVWHYNSAETFQLSDPLWEKYGTVFTYVWGATAFKGATASCQILPVNKYHVSNHEAWLSQLGLHAGKIANFRGIVLTGWSRFDHYATLCELLPTSIPSLCLCLKTWLSGGYTQALHKLHTWFNQWQVLNNYTNPMQVDTILPVVTECLNELILVDNYLKNHLEQIYYPHTIEELSGTLITPIKEHLKQIKSDCETQLSLGCRVRGQRRLNL